MVDLLCGLHVVFEEPDGVLPCLQALGEQAGGLFSGISQQVSVAFASCLICGHGRTVLGSVSGTALSLKVLDMVPCLIGIIFGSSAILVGGLLFAL